MKITRWLMAAALALGAVSTVLALHGRVFAEAPKVRAGRSWTVSVKKSAGRIVVMPDTVKMIALDKVRWAGPSGLEFRLVFPQGRSPFTESLLSAAKARKYRFPAPKAAGDYKYSVISGADTLDPVIRIEPPPPPGGDSSGVGPK